MDRRKSLLVSALLTLLGAHAFLLGVALDYSAAYLQAASGFTILWFMIGAAAAGALKR